MLRKSLILVQNSAFIVSACMMLAGSAWGAESIFTISPNPERGGTDGPALVGAPTTRIVYIDPRKSLFVTDLAAMKAFSFAEVMDALAKESGEGVTKRSLFAEWWDTANAKPGRLPPHEVNSGHCDDGSAAVTVPVEPNFSFSRFNGFPIQCARNEGEEALSDPFSGGTGGYSAIAVVNRFDLAQAGKTCGEYRVVFARNHSAADGNPNLVRNLIIFEAAMPDPKLSADKSGCIPLQRFWESLSAPAMSPQQRGTELHRLFLEGLNGTDFGPVIAVKNFGLGDGRFGQVRTNQFMNPRGFEQNWLLREFKFTEFETGQFRLQQQTVKTNPGAELFAGASNDPRVQALAERINAEMRDGNLLSNDIGSFSFSNEDILNSADSDEMSEVRSNYVEAMNTSSSGFVKQQISKELIQLGSTLTAENVAARIMAMSCAGCHELSNEADNLGFGNQLWPKSLRFTHVSELDTETVDGVERFAIFDAVKAFLPRRTEILVKFLETTPLEQ